MANNRYGYMARIGADTSGLRAGLQEADSALQRTQRELNAVNRSIRDAEAAGVSSAAAVAQKRELLNQEIERTRQKLNDLRSIEQQMQQAAGNGTISAEQYRQYQREIQNTQTSLARYQNQLRETYGMQGKLNDALENTGQAFNKVKGIVLAATGAGATATVADTSGLRAGLQEADSALQRTQRELNAVNRSIRDAEAAGVSSAAAVAQKRELLNQEIERTRQKLNDLRSIEQQMQQAADNGTISAEQYRQYQREIQNTQTSLARYQNQLRETYGMQGKLNDALEKTGQVLDKAAKTALTAAGTAAGASVAGIAKLTQEASQAYGEFEHLKGGIETLFGDDMNTVLHNSQNAFKTAGLSVNDYLNTVMTSSTAMVKALGGDTAAAAEKSDMMVRDMADNTNKLGTSIASIQWAYQGFAKQTYTMLDNLKLGYGGTKKEMERLLEDAGKLANTKFDISSFADVADAIHVIQENIGITGTTALGAEHTIQGSMNRLKAAWTNLVAGMADKDANIEQLITDFTESFEIAMDNLLPVIERTVPNILSTLPQMASTIAKSFVTALMQSTEQELDEQAVETIGKGIEQLGDAFRDAAAQLAVFMGEKGIPAAIDALEWIAGHLDDIAGLFRTLIETWAAWHIAEKAGQLAQLVMNLKNLIPVLSSATAGMEALDAATAVNAFAAAAAAAVLLAEGIKAIAKATLDAKLENDAHLSGTTELTDAITEQTAALREQLEAFDDEKKKISENSEACRYWWNILQNVTDEQGNVNGELDTAQTAVEALNQLMGTHIELLNGQVQGYSDLVGSMDEYIRTAERQAQIDYLKDDYAKATLELPKVNEEFTAVKEQYDTFSPLYDSAMKVISEQKGRSPLKRDYGQLYMLMNQAGLNPADYVSSITGVLDLDKVKKAFDDKNRDLSMQYLGLSEQIRQYNGIIDQYTALETELLTSQTESTVSTSAPSQTVTYHDDTAEKEAGAKQRGREIRNREKALKRELSRLDGSSDGYYSELARILAEYSDIAYTDTYKDAKKILDKHNQSKSGGTSGGGENGSTWKDKMQSELEAEDVRYYQSGEKDEEQHLKNRLAIVEKYRQENEIAWWNVYNSEKKALDKYNSDQEEADKKRLGSIIETAGAAVDAVAEVIEKRKKAAADALGELVYSEGDDLDEYLSKINDTVSYWAEQGVDITEEAAVKKTEAEQKEYDARLKNAADFAQKISEEQKRRAENMLGGDLTSEAESPTGEKIAYFDDLSERAKQISKYIENYKKLQELGLPNDLLNEIESMSFKDKAAAVAELVKMNPQKRDLYISDYTALKAKQAEAAAMETEDDVQAAMADIFADVPDSVYQSGKDAADKYIQGIMDEFNEKGITIDPAILGNYSYNANRTDGGTGTASTAEKQAQSAGMMTDASEKQVQSADRMTDASEKQVQSASMMTDAASAWSAAVDKFNAAVQSIPDTIRIDAVSGKTPITINVAGKDVIRTTVGELMRTKRITDA